MQGIEFETDKTYAPKTAFQSSPIKRSWALSLLSKVGINDTTTANYVLLGVAAILFGVTIFMYAGMIGEPKKDWSLDARAIADMQMRQPLK